MYLVKLLGNLPASLNIVVNAEQLIVVGNTCREQRQYAQALAYYAQAFVLDHNNASAWNNYGNVIREMGYPERAIPFLQQCLAIDPSHSTAKFNLAVAYLLMGDYDKGWQAYESRWQFEHLNGQLPEFKQPRYAGQSLEGKTILVLGEQGLGDTVQFVRYVWALKGRGANVILVVPSQMVSMFRFTNILTNVLAFDDPLPEFDYWTPIMSLPFLFNEKLSRLLSPLQYIEPDKDLSLQWKERFGKKVRLRVGIAWSGRRDTWINQHKSVPFDLICNLIKSNPQYQWINLQVDATFEESQKLQSLGVELYPGAITCMADTAALIDNLDVVIAIDSLIGHLAGAMAKPTWIMLNAYAVDWRWLLNRNDSPWYPSVRLFRQPSYDNWLPVIDRVAKHLDLFKV